MTGYVIFWYLLGVKLTWGHAHKTRSWYLLGVTFKKSDKHPRHLYMGVPPQVLMHLFSCLVLDIHVVSLSSNRFIVLLKPTVYVDWPQ